MDTVRLYAQCHCRKQTLHCDVSRGNFPLENWACHCDDCRHVTGLLFADYIMLPRDLRPEHFPFDPEKPPSGLSQYRISPNSRIIWYFCSNCGAHIASIEESRDKDGEKSIHWSFSQGITYPLYLDDGTKISKRVKHNYVKMGRDKGGAAPYLPDGVPRYITEDDRIAPKDERPTPEQQEEIDKAILSKTLPLSCLCGHVKLTAHRPYSRRVEEKWQSAIKNEGWGWNFCLCDSCRTTSGFDSSCFFYLPYTHIDGPPGSKHATDGLKLYLSYHNTRRWFCPTCGASIFYDNLDRGDLTDVFMGLIDIPLAGVFDSWATHNKGISYWYDARDEEFAEVLRKGVCPEREMPKGPSDPSKLANYDGTLQL